MVGKGQESARSAAEFVPRQCRGVNLKLLEPGDQDFNDKGGIGRHGSVRSLWSLMGRGSARHDLESLIDEITRRSEIAAGDDDGHCPRQQLRLVLGKLAAMVDDNMGGGLRHDQHTALRGRYRNAVVIELRLNRPEGLAHSGGGGERYGVHVAL